MVLSFLFHDLSTFLHFPHFQKHRYMHRSGCFWQVMGGKSTGSFAVEKQLGIFDGEVVDVPFLKAPGFIKTSVVDMMPGVR